jgi:two-component system response regulator FixJ
LVDDDASFLVAMERMLRTCGFCARPFASAEKLLAELPDDVSGCVVTDLDMPEMSGLDLMRELSKKDVRLPVVFLTGQGDIPASVRAMREGAVDFLEKHAPKDAVIQAVNQALAKNARERAMRMRLTTIRARLESLSMREKEVLTHVIQGKLNKQIADDLGIHERTVKLHRTAITTKLQTPSAAQLALLVHEAGVLEEWSRTFFPKG